MTSAPTIGITLGDPSGISPEIICRAVAGAPPPLRERLIIFGDREALAEAGGLPDGVTVDEVTHLDPADRLPGKPTRGGGAAQVAYLEAAVAAAREGRIQALVTAPMSKTQARAAGFAFTGHTDFLADRLEAREHAMMFAGPRLRVVLATIHVPLRDVSTLLSPDLIARAAFLGAESLIHDFGIARPRVGVVGLNPHASEGGLFGDEERRVIGPGMDLARKRLGQAGLDATVAGPLIPDAAFRDAVEGRWDLLVALYHDQGLIPIKLVDFEESVNVTVGLPIVRTSPDHGVAYDIAGTGRARATSFAAALQLADQMARRRPDRR